MSVNVTLAVPDRDTISHYVAPPVEAVIDSAASRGRRVAELAAAHAGAVDRDAVFPKDAIEEARRERLLSMIVPVAYGGDGASIGDTADICYILGQACASTAMIFAMHQAALACVVRHARDSAWHVGLLRRVAEEQLLLASSTTEGSGGGNVRSSEAALVRDGDVLHFERAATVMSYGAQADGIVSTARRTPEAAASDQVLVVLRREDIQLESTGGWDTLGMRGTCSGGFAMKAQVAAEQVLPGGYDKIHPVTMVPVSHLVWAGVWTGIAAAAVAKAQMFVRTAARRAGGQSPPGAQLATLASARLRTLRGTVDAALAAFARIEHDELALAALATQTSFSLFKVEVSDMAVETVSTAMRACGLSGYRNDGPFGIGRHLRDILSAPVMVHNERILANIGNAALLSGVPEGLRGNNVSET